ncbi:FAD-dependent oxidoreductase [Klenkia terrae]|uniref:FAD-dependent oxidoreductase n=1 Tax=Klenkia terrae TaxID=1052259 RepID=UPI00360F7396
MIVVGAGPVGLTAALLLGRRGHEVRVLERRPEPPGCPAPCTWTARRCGCSPTPGWPRASPR